MEDQERSNAQNADSGTHIKTRLDAGMEQAPVLPYETLIHEHSIQQHSNRHPTAPP